MESLRDNLKDSVQKYCVFSEYLPIIIITFISNNPRRGYHNCPLSTVNCPLERSDKHQFIVQNRYMLWLLAGDGKNSALGQAFVHKILYIFLKVYGIMH